MDQFRIIIIVVHGGEGAGVMELFSWACTVLQYFAMFLPLIESLWCALPVEVYTSD